MGDPRSPEAQLVKPVRACPQFPQSCGDAAAGDGAVWVSLVPDNTVERIDPQMNTVTETIPVGPQPEGGFRVHACLPASA